jgi:4'-phosphopantetheinyl transferase
MHDQSPQLVAKLIKPSTSLFTGNQVASRWVTSGKKHVPEPGCIHLWRMDLTQTHASQYESALSTEELGRKARFVFERDRERFSRTRIGLRRLISSYLGTTPADVCFVQNEFGKPRVQGDSTIGFNVSHSEDVAIIAVGQLAEIGVDVESVRPLTDLFGIAKSVFSVAENDVLQSLDDGERSSAFFTCWTRKEAYLKAIGVGLTLEPSSLTVGLSPGRRVVPIAGRDPAANCEVVTVHRDARNIVSLATVGKCKEIKLFNFDFES